MVPPDSKSFPELCWVFSRRALVDVIDDVRTFENIADDEMRVDLRFDTEDRRRVPI